MAKYLSETGFSYFFNRIKTLFASKSALDALSERVDDVISEGGEPNVIETIKVNGTALTPDAQKAVDIEVPKVQKVADGAIRVDDADGSNFLAVDNGNVSSGFSLIAVKNSPGAVATEARLATVEYVDENGGKIDNIKVNGVEQAIDPADKSVNILMPTAVSDLTNDSGFQTADDVQNAIDTAVFRVYRYKGSVANAAALPASGNTDGDVYDVQDTGMNYAWNGTAWDAMSQIVDTSLLWAKTELVALTTAEIDAIVDA